MPGRPEEHRDADARHAVDRVLEHLERTRGRDAADLALMRTRLARTALSRGRRRRTIRTTLMPLVPAAGAACALLAALALAWHPGRESSPEPVAVASQVPPEVLANIDFYEWLARRQRLEQIRGSALSAQGADHDRR